MASARSRAFALSLAIWITTGAARADILTFQQGDGGAYSTTDATFLNQSLTNDGSGAILHVVTIDVQSVIRFPDVFGANPGQIPPGSTVISALLTLTTYDPTVLSATTDVHRVYVAWDENTVNGIDFWSQPGVLVGPKIGTMPVDYFEPVSSDVTALVQDWANGDPNFGVMLQLRPPIYDPSGYNVTQYFSDDAAEPSYRPKLTVEFTPPAVAVESTTWGRVKALYR